MINKARSFISLFLGLLSAKASEAGYFTEKFHMENSFRVYYSYFYLEDPKTQNYGTEFRIVGYEVMWSSQEGKRSFGFGFGGDVKNKNSYAPPMNLGLFQYSFEQFLNPDRTGLFFKTKAIFYNVSFTEAQNSPTLKSAVSIGAGYVFPINEYFSLGLTGSKLFDSVAFRKSEYIFELHIDAKFPSTKETNIMNEILTSIR